MHNFLKHRFQIDLDQSVENPSKYSVGNEINYNELLAKSKMEIREYCEHEYNARLEKERERIDRQYRSELDKLINQVNKDATIIENKNEEIKKLEKENGNLKEKLGIAKEVTTFYSKCFLDVYHLKT